MEAWPCRQGAHKRSGCPQTAVFQCLEVLCSPALFSDRLAGEIDHTITGRKRIVQWRRRSPAGLQGGIGLNPIKTLRHLSREGGRRDTATDKRELMTGGLQNGNQTAADQAGASDQQKAHGDGCIRVSRLGRCSGIGVLNRQREIHPAGHGHQCETLNEQTKEHHGKSEWRHGRAPAHIG